MAKIDEYNLKATTEFPLVGTEEVSEDLVLTESTASSTGVVNGTVTSGGSPVTGATVKLFDSSGNPFAHDTTSTQGKFSFTQVAAGSYTVTATKTGYLTPDATAITVVANRPTTVTIALTADPDAELNTLYGKIQQETVLTAIEDATVNIYEVVEGVRTLISTTFTNSSGQYLTPSLSSGDYIVVANKDGYYQSESEITTLTTSDLQSLDLALIVNTVNTKGTISGIVTDDTTLLPISGAVVALYLIDGTTETIIQLTSTNSDGLYLFGEVSEGTYIVKSFAQTTD